MMKRNSIVKAIILVMTVGSLLIGTSLGAFAQSVSADIKSELPKELKIGDSISHSENSLSVSGLQEYAGYTFSAWTEGDALQVPEYGGIGGGDDNITTVSEDGSAKIYIYGDYVAVKEGTVNIHPYILKRPDGYPEDYVYGINELQIELLEKAFNEETGLNVRINQISLDDPNFNRLQSWVNEHADEYYEAAKSLCIEVGTPITVTVKAAGGDNNTNNSETETKRTALKKLSEEKSFNKSDYTEESFKAYSAALEKARQVLNNPNAAKEEIENAQNELNKAISGLKRRAADAGSELPKTGDGFSRLAILLLIVSATGIVLSAKKITHNI